MQNERGSRAVSAFAAFVSTQLPELLDEHASGDPTPALLALFQRTVAEVPAYAALLAERGVDPGKVRTLADFQGLPLVTRDSYVKRYPLPERCRAGDLSSCDMVAVSSGSTGEPTLWPRSVADEFAVAQRFEQVFRDGFEADSRRTLAVVCFPLGTWIGGIFTASCCRHLAAKGYPITVVTPGNQKAEILRAVRSLSPLFEQTVLLGYPPFLKDVVDAGAAEGIRWKDHSVKLVLAGEVFSEEWRALMAERAGMAHPLRDSASLYGTADAGVLGNETPLSACIRRFLADNVEAARALFGEARLPTLVQYDPFVRYFEQLADGTLVVSGDNGVPLVRYHIADDGGVVPYAEMLERLRQLGFDAVAEAAKAGARAIRALPFVYVFGRSQFAVSFYGANVFPETVSIALEQPETRVAVTGKFVLEVREDAGRDRWLDVAIELAPSVEPTELLRETLKEAIRGVLLRLNSEFSSYVPPGRQSPRVTLYPTGHPDYFPVGVKHRYSRK
jgi:phenylacetate-CoA ligase